MHSNRYLMSYGKVGDFGLFESDSPQTFQRGDRLVVRSQRGLELGLVLRPAVRGHVELLSAQYLGQILRPASTQDEEAAARMADRSQNIYIEGRRLAVELSLPLEILDAEVFLDGQQAVLHHLRWQECDPRPLMEPLSEQFRLLVTLHDLALPPAAKEEEAGCGEPNCGSKTGGCGSCSSGGCGTCSSHHHAPEPVATLDRFSLH